MTSLKSVRQIGAAQPALSAAPLLLALAAVLAVSGCAPKAAPAVAGDVGEAPLSIAALAAAAKAEGQLNVIALPHDWCGYGGVIAGFKATYGLTVNELNPDASSAEEIDAIRRNGSDSAQAPDVVDLRRSFAEQAALDGLVRPYKVANWNSIPAALKDADGRWSGDYFGVISFAVNTSIIRQVPADWGDLQSPGYHQAVALSGDPRVSHRAIMAIYAAGLASNNASPAAASAAGLGFFADLNKRGNFVPVIGTHASLAAGQTPLLLGWDYTALADRWASGGNPNSQVVVPRTGVVGDFYAQAISITAPHPHAARLWMEYLYSDAGQLALLHGYCHPVRYSELAAAGKIPADLAAQLPPAEAYKNVTFSTLDTERVIKAAITGGWDSTVGADVK